MVITLTPQTPQRTAGITPLGNEPFTISDIYMEWNGKGLFAGNAPFTLLSIGITTEYGMITNTPTNFEIFGLTDTPEIIYNDVVPFTPGEYMIGQEKLRTRQDIFAGSITNCRFLVSIQGNLSTIKIPDEIIGNEILITPFFKIDIDERAILGV